MLQLTGGIPSGIGSIISKAKDTYEETDTHVHTVTGSAITYFLGGDPTITYYVGGAGASDSNTGTSTLAPFATLARTVEEINNTPGDYEVIMLGNTAEPRTSTIGDGVNEFNVNIKTVTGSAIVKRNGDVPGDFITVSNHTNLTLGESEDSYSSVLTIDGGRTYFVDGVSYGPIIKVNEGGTLVTHDRVVIQNIYRWTFSYNNYGGAVYNAGVFDMYGGTIQLCYASLGSGVYNIGTFRLYGGSIRENGRASYGSGVYNAEAALFEMYGGSISDNDGDSYAGGVGNAGTFRLLGGSIDNNYANSNGGVHNGMTGIIYMSGGAIDNNLSDYSSAGILNSGSIYMSGGSISGNDCSDRGGGISNYGLLNISGGTIENNHAQIGGAVYGADESELSISGGIICNNTATLGGSIYSEGEFELSGNAQIPAGIDGMNNIHLLSPLTITGDITYADSYLVVLDNYSSSVGEQWIRGTTGELISDNISKFILANSNYSFDNNGYLLSIAQPRTYYVGGDNASDANDGTQDNPFATLDYAFEIGNDSTSTFILQSDQILTETVDIKGDITLMSDGMSRKVSKSPDFMGDYMIVVESGSLTLGNKNNLDSSDLLIFDGLGESSYYGFLRNEGSVNIYNGVTIRNFSTQYYCIANFATLNIHGGSIEYNENNGYGIICNLKNMYINGGYIRFNNGRGIFNSDVDVRDILPESEPELHMLGGAIYGNTAEIGSAVYIMTGNIVVSGSAAFSNEGDLQNEIYIDNMTGLITIGGDLNTSDQILVGRGFYYDGQQMLGGEASLIRNNYSKFILTSPHYFINEQGIIRDNYTASVYYINSQGNDSATGSIDDPLATIHKAIQMIGTEKGTIILQSDITINQSIVVTGNVTIQSDGNVRNIYRGESFTIDEENYGMSDCMFYVTGKLSLGNMKGNDLNPNLFINGNGDLGEAQIGAIIQNRGRLELYPGVVIHNNISENSISGIISYGDFHMYGGCIRDNVSEYMNGVFVATGTFTMDGGTIRNNSGELTGVIVFEGTFIMNGGSITENIGMEGAGIFAMAGTVMINGGCISRNDATISGILAEGSRLYIKGGIIEENVGMYAGIYAANYTETSIRGGNIRNNSGIMAAGVLIGMRSSLDFSGGRIGGNEGLFFQGICIDEESRLALSGSAIVEADNKIILQVWNSDGKIMITGPLTSKVTGIIDIYRMEMDEEINYTQEFTLGKRLLETGGAYNFTWDDVSRLVLADSDYAINTFGIIRKAIKKSGVSSIGSQVYSGREKTPQVVVKDGDMVLTKGEDYLVRYRNNMNTGQATVLIAGIGDYGGVIEAHFNIYKAKATRILTPTPLDKSFSASLHMTEAELLESITLKHVEVAHHNGTGWLPVEWKMTQGSYNPLGGTYIYTGTVLSDDNIDANGLTLTMKIVVEPFEAYYNETLSIGEDNEKKVSIVYRRDGNYLYIDFLIDEEVFSGDDRVVISITGDELLRQLEAGDVENSSITLTIPSSILDAEDSDLYSLILEDKLVKAAREAGSDLTISIRDENGMERYSWTFRGEDLRNSSNESIVIDLGLSIRKLDELEEANDLEANEEDQEGANDLEVNGEDQDEVNDLEDNEEGETGVGFVISFDHSGDLPSQASVRIYVGDKEGVKPGNRIYLYYYNPDTGKLETLPGGYGYLVDDEGYISVDVLHCSKYVVLYQEAEREQITSLRDQIKVTLEDSIIYIGVKDKPDKTNINIKLPKTLELVENLEDDTSQSAIGGVTASYQSSNTTVAIVDEHGNITAKGRGTSTITTKLTLYNGKVKTVRTVVIVRNR